MGGTFYNGGLPLEAFNHAFVCAEGALRFAAPSPPLRGPYLFCLGRKDMEEKTAGERNSAYAQKKLVVPFCMLSFCFRRQNALRAAIQSDFPSARYTVRVVSFAPVEYLTYGIRKAVLFARTATHIAHKRTAIQDVSEIDAEYFDDHAGLSKAHLNRVLQI